MDITEQLRVNAKWRKKKPQRAIRLGDVVKRLVDERISPQQTRYGQILEEWQRVLPVELLEHCRLVSIDGCKLKVLADSPAHLYELRLCKEQLLGQLQQQCPRAKIRDIEIVLV